MSYKTTACQTEFLKISITGKTNSVGAAWTKHGLKTNKTQLLIIHPTETAHHQKEHLAEGWIFLGVIHERLSLAHPTPALRGSWARSCAWRSAAVPRARGAMLVLRGLDRRELSAVRQGARTVYVLCVSTWKLYLETLRGGVSPHL